MRSQTYQDWELIVVGQGDESVLRTTVESAAAGDGRVSYLHLERRGLSIARNAGFRAGTGEIVALIDDDCEAAPEWLGVLDEYFADETVGFVGGSLVAPPSTRRLASCPETIVGEVVLDPAHPGPTSLAGWTMAAGGNIAIRRSTFDQVGMFDEYLGAGTDFGSSEDSDYGLRLESAGQKLVTTPKSVVHHTHGHRYGLRAVYRHKRNYARGYGALAAKRALLGDTRSVEWRRALVDEMRTRCRPRRLATLPNAVLRYLHFRRAYDQCVRGYVVEPANDPIRAVLRPR